MREKEKLSTSIPIYLHLYAPDRKTSEELNAFVTEELGIPVRVTDLIEIQSSLDPDVADVYIAQVLKAFKLMASEYLDDPNTPKIIKFSEDSIFSIQETDIPFSIAACDLIGPNSTELTPHLLLMKPSEVSWNDYVTARAVMLGLINGVLKIFEKPTLPVTGLNISE